MTLSDKSNYFIKSNTSGVEAVTTEHDVQRLMLALTRLLPGGRGDPHRAAFNAALMVVVGAPLATSGLLRLADLARLNRRHAVHLSFEPGRPIPRIAFAYRQGDIVTVHEKCFLAVLSGSDRVAIVPDSFADGAFQLGSDMKLRRGKAPASFEAAMPMMQQAYTRFGALLGSAVPTDNWRPLRVSARCDINEASFPREVVGSLLDRGVASVMWGGWPAGPPFHLRAARHRKMRCAIPRRLLPNWKAR